MSQETRAPPASKIANRNSKIKKVARHSTALEESRYRCCLPALAEFTLLPMHGTWPTRTMSRSSARATPISAAFSAGSTCSGRVLRVSRKRLSSSTLRYSIECGGAACGGLVRPRNAESRQIRSATTKRASQATPLHWKRVSRGDHQQGAARLRLYINRGSEDTPLTADSSAGVPALHQSVSTDPSARAVWSRVRPV